MDVALEIVRAGIVGLVFVYLYRIGNAKKLKEQAGWGWLLLGFGAILFGSLLDITDNFPSLNKFVVIGDTPQQAVLEKIVGYLLGFLLLAVGLMKWIPYVVSLRETKQALALSRDELEEKVEALQRAGIELDERKSRAAELNSLNQQLQREIAERHRVESALALAKERAEEATRAKSEFLANMSHEIRTPLNGVLGMMELLRTTPLTGEQKEYANTALSSGQGLLAVINDILDLSRIEAGRMEIVEEGFDLSPLLTQAADLFKHQAANKGVLFNLHIDEGLPCRVLGDGERIRQILFNLAGNAVKFTSEGEVTVEARAVPSYGEESVGLQLLVSDTGVGIPENKLEAILEPFTQVDGSFARNHGGTGLGLAIVTKLLELMGGSLELESREGRGTTARVNLQLKPLRSDAPVKDDSSSGEDAAIPRYTILLVEDEEVNRLMVRRMLEKMGHSVLCAVNGWEALRVLGKEKVDCVLLDVQMAGMDGMETIRIIRNSDSPPWNSAVPVVALTAHAMQGDREKCLEAGMDDYLTKPVSMEGLANVLARVSGRP